MRSTRPCLGVSILLFCTVLFAIPVQAQTEISSGVPAPPRSFYISTDYASFEDLADAASDYLEIYYSYNRRELEFLPEEPGTAIATILMQLIIKDEQGKEVENRLWTTSSQAGSVEEAKTVDFMIIDVIGIRLKPGNYLITLQARDANSMATGEAILKAKVRDFSKNQLQMSDLELAFNIADDTTNGRFFKAGKKIIPNPSRIFTRERSMLYFYGELYNLVFDPQAKPDYTLDFSVLDTTGKQIKEYGEQTHAKPGNSAVIISGINIGPLGGGEYLLQVEAQDKQTGQKVSSTKKFMIFREKTADEIIGEQIKQFKQDVIYIASPSELSIFDQLNNVGKKNYIDEFWKKKDPTPGTPENEFKTEHYRRIAYANATYSRSSSSDDGWNTDMGRIYIRYGEPSEIERHPSTRGEKPWEKWNYNDIQGGVYFIFLDEDGYGVYRLVHSTMTGEVKDSQWEERIKSRESYEE